MKTAIITVGDVLYLQKTQDDGSVETVIYQPIETSSKTGKELIAERHNNSPFPVTFWNQLLVVQDPARLVMTMIFDSPQARYMGPVSTATRFKPKSALTAALESL